MCGVVWCGVNTLNSPHCTAESGPQSVSWELWRGPQSELPAAWSPLLTAESCRLQVCSSSQPAVDWVSPHTWTFDREGEWESERVREWYPVIKCELFIFIKIITEPGSVCLRHSLLAWSALTCNKTGNFTGFVTALQSTLSEHWTPAPTEIVLERESCVTRGGGQLGICYY